VRYDILERKEEILVWIAERRSKAFICRELNCKPETLNFHLRRMKIEYQGNRGEQGWKKPVNSRKTEDYLVNGSLIGSHKLKLRLLRDNIKDYRCERCEIITWNGIPTPLELHHRNGDRRDNRLCNLQLLCPNCHAQEPNNSGRGKRAPVSQLAEEHGLEPCK
jgi:hypothetical protein